MIVGTAAVRYNALLCALYPYTERFDGVLPVLAQMEAAAVQPDEWT